jgi:Rieske Fe-S protein
MGKCIKCGNEYDKSFEIRMGEMTYVFDSFECAISELAPKCKHCGCTIIGHGLENDGIIYCCASCAADEGEVKLSDRV